MKRICIIILFTIGLQAQNKQLLYGLNTIPQSLQLNPGAIVTNDWYVAVPLLSHVHAHVGMTGLSAYDIFADDNRNFNLKLRDAIYNMKNNDFFAVNQQLDIFSAGFAFGRNYEKNQYLSFGLYQETDVIAYFPKDPAILAYEGNANNINRYFNANDFNVKGEVISALHIGYNKKVNNKFTYGIRGKLYSSILNVNSTRNEGYFVTQLGDNNFLRHTFNLNVNVQTSGLASLLNDDTSDISQDIKTLRKRMLFGGNLGLGVDFGFTYAFTKQWQIAASVQDIGFISHKKDVETNIIDGTIQYEGINPTFPDLIAGQTAEDYWEEVSQDFDNLFEVETTTTKYTTWRPIKFNAMASYAYGNTTNKDCNCRDNKEGYKNNVGLHLFAVNRPRQLQMALTAFYTKKILQGLEAKATYTVDAFSYKNLGLGLNSQIGKINFYLMADNILEYQNLAKAQSVSLQLGFNYIFNNNEN